MSTSPKASGLWTMPKGEFEESVASLEREIIRQGGNPCDLFDLFRTNSHFTGNIAATMVREGLSGSTQVKLARMLSGQNIFDVTDWTALYGVNFTKKQHREAAKFPWGEDVLNSPCPFNADKLVKDTHFAFLGIERINGDPPTVAKWLTVHPKTGQPRFWFANDPWHVGQPHTDEVTLAFRWYLLLKNIIPNSTGKTPEEQVAMLPPEYEVPTTIVEVTKDILVFRKTGVRPNPSRWATCTERTIKTDKLPAEHVGYVSCVGYFDEDGLRVSHWHGDRSDDVGAGASRNFYLIAIMLSFFGEHFAYRSFVDFIHPPSIRPISSVFS